MSTQFVRGINEFGFDDGRHWFVKNSASRRSDRTGRPPSRLHSSVWLTMNRPEPRMGFVTGFTSNNTWFDFAGSGQCGPLITA